MRFRPCPRIPTAFTDNPSALAPEPLSNEEKKRNGTKKHVEVLRGSG